MDSAFAQWYQPYFTGFTFFPGISSDLLRLLSNLPQVSETKSCRILQSVAEYSVKSGMRKQNKVALKSSGTPLQTIIRRFCLKMVYTKANLPFWTGGSRHTPDGCPMWISPSPSAWVRMWCTTRPTECWTKWQRL